MDATDAAIDPISQMVKMILDNGIMIVICGIVLVFGSYLLWTCVRMVKTYGPKLADAIIGMIESLRICNETNTKSNETNTRNFECVSDTCRVMSDTLTVLTEAVQVKMDPTGDKKYERHMFSNVPTNEAISHCLEGAKQAIEHGDPKKALPYIDRGIEALRT